MCRGFEWQHTQQPGDLLQFGVTRHGDELIDTCGDLKIIATQLRY